MVGELAENNMVTVAGKVSTELKYSHEIYGEGFYFFLLDVPRLSDSSDSISVTISERLIGKRKLEVGSAVEIEGQFRSYNSIAESGSKLLLTVFAREIAFIDGDGAMRNPNKIFLNGYICKKPIYRCTPFGREITDLLIAVNRAYNKSDYIPCISWGRNARFCSGLSVGDNIKIWGRIQSRSYQKKFDNGSVAERVAYEVSLSKLEVGGARRAAEGAGEAGSARPGGAAGMAGSAVAAATAAGMAGATGTAGAAGMVGGTAAAGAMATGTAVATGMAGEIAAAGAAGAMAATATGTAGAPEMAGRAGMAGELPAGAAAKEGGASYEAAVADAAAKESGAVFAAASAGEAAKEAGAAGMGVASMGVAGMGVASASAASVSAAGAMDAAGGGIGAARG
jgi:single-stranded DNA-binding protein